jgi:hypothetical protein
MIVQASNGRKLDETGYPLTVIRASFTSRMLRFMTNFAPLLTNICYSRVYDTNMGLIKVVV